MKRIGLNPYIVLFLLLILASSCQSDEDSVDEQALDEQLEQRLKSLSPDQKLDFFVLPEEGEWREIPQDPLNPITATKVKLGKMLYHEPALGTKAKHMESLQTYSCASCHFAAAGFQAGRFQGIGDGGQRFGLNRELKSPFLDDEVDAQDIRTPTVLNAAYQEVMLWNGQFGATGPNSGTEAQWTANTPKENNHLGYQGVEIQAIAGLTVHRMEIDPDEMRNLGYASLFDQAFPDFPIQDRYSLETAGLAIAAYERTVLANRAPFQYWLQGQREQMSIPQKQGAILFFGKAGCGNCHTGPALNSMEFHSYGMSDLFECGEIVFHATEQSVGNKGRGGFTTKAEDMYKFKVPQLYNLRMSPFFGHGSSFRSVREVIDYKNAGQAQNPRVPATQLADDFKPLSLSALEIDQIADFIENALFDPAMERYEPKSVLSGMCFPFNDPVSRVELGCD